VRTVQKIAKNTGVIIIGEVIFKLISLFITIYLARYLGIIGFGKYNFVFAYLAFFNIITDLGLQQILVREMARDPLTAPKLIGNAYIIRIILTTFAIVLAIVIMTLMSYPVDMTLYIYIASFTLLFISFSDFYATIFQANLAMEYGVVSKLIFKFLSAGLILYLIFTGGTLTGILLAMVFSEMIKTLLHYYFSRKFVKPVFEIDFGLWKRLFKESLPLAFTSVIWIIYFRIDVVMLSMMQGDAAVGLYSAAYKLSDPLALVPSALVISLFPIMSASFKESKEKLVKIYRLGLKYILIIMLPIAVGVTFVADRAILLIYEPEFAPSAVVLQILIWAILFGSINYILLDLLVAIDRQVLNIWTMGVGAVVNVVLNLILIPIISFTGAAITTVVTNALICVVCFYFVSKYLQKIPVWRMLVIPMAACTVMGGVLFYFSNTNLLLLIFLAVVTYFITLLGLKVFDEDEWNIIKRVIRRE
jgi:O-antigen/teichoic acid export membrane protein